MRYIFIIQGEGRGHLTQAISLSKLLREAGHELDRVLVGRCSARELPDFFAREIGAPIERYDAPSIDYGSGGKRANMLLSALKGLAPRQLGRWIRSMRHIATAVEQSGADCIINLYELLMGPAAVIHNIKVPIISIAHQFLINHPHYPLHERCTAQLLLGQNNRVCSLRSHKVLSLSLYPLPSATSGREVVVPPLLRPELFAMRPTSGDYLLGYLLNHAFLEEIEAWRRRADGSPLHLFWDKSSAPAVVEHLPNLWLHRLDDKEFIRLMEGCRGYLTTAGFESVCEAAYMGKPVMMVPSHLEQQINARDAAYAGVGIIAEAFDVEALIDFIPNYNFDVATFRRWVDSAGELLLRELTDVATVR